MDNYNYDDNTNLIVFTVPMMLDNALIDIKDELHIALKCRIYTMRKPLLVITIWLLNSSEQIHKVSYLLSRNLAGRFYDNSFFVDQSLPLDTSSAALQ